MAAGEGRGMKQDAALSRESCRHCLSDRLHTMRPLVSILLVAAAAVAQNFADVRPSPQQLAWQELEIGVLIHFGPNTFMDREWGDGTADPAVFNPPQLDAEQWVLAAKAGGARYLVMVAKHHDGFCLWPTRHTDYSVRRSPWRGGKGDLVKEVEQACRKHGLAFGIYNSPWDRHEPSYKDNAAYDRFYTRTMTELATRYGPLVEYWLDGAGSEGHVYGFEHYTRVLRTYQPNVSVFGSIDFIPFGEIRWVGNESGFAHEENWNVIDVWGNARWRPAEADTPLREGHWFWHPNAEKRLKTLDQLMDTYAKTVGRGAQLVLGLAPDSRGLMPEADVARLREFGDELNRVYGRKLGRSAKDNVQFDSPARIDRVMIREDLAQGQRIRRFRVEVKTGGAWKEAASGTTIGNKRILMFEPVTAESVRVRVDAALAEPKLLETSAHFGGR